MMDYEAKMKMLAMTLGGAIDWNAADWKQARLIDGREINFVDGAGCVNAFISDPATAAEMITEDLGVDVDAQQAADILALSVKEKTTAVEMQRRVNKIALEYLKREGVTW